MSPFERELTESIAYILLYLAAGLVFGPLAFLVLWKRLASTYAPPAAPTSQLLEVRYLGLGLFKLPILGRWLQVQLCPEGLYVHLNPFIPLDAQVLLFPWQCLAGKTAKDRECMLDVAPSNEGSAPILRFQLYLPAEADGVVERLMGECRTKQEALAVVRGTPSTWKELAHGYRCESRPPGPIFDTQPCSFEWPSDVKVTVVVAKAGLFLSRYVMFGYRLPSVLLPWDRVVSVEKGSVGLFDSGLKIELRVNRARMYVGLPIKATAALREVVPSLIDRLELSIVQRPGIFGGLFGR
ncbi:MAG TPA: hypothetical protein VGE01_00950 [Fimbriimonas sp.]